MKTMNMPGFTAENSIHKTMGRYSVATAFDSQNTVPNVQPAAYPYHCRRFLVAWAWADAGGDDLWAEFWGGAYEACMWSEPY